MRVGTAVHKTIVLSWLLVSACAPVPATPDPPHGPVWAVRTETLEYLVISPASGSEILALRVDWGDGTQSDWTPFIQGSATVAFSHSWTAAGEYSLCCQSLSSQGRTSDWSEACTVRVLPEPGYPDSVVAFVEFGQNTTLGPSGSRREDLWSILPSPDGRKVYVGRTGRLSVVRTSDWTEADPVEFPNGAFGMAMMLDGRQAWIAGTGTLWVFDTWTDSVLDSIPVACDPRLLVSLPDGSKLYGTLAWPGKNVFAIRTSDYSVESIPVSGEHTMLAVAPSGEYVYVPSEDDWTVAAIRTADNTVERTTYIPTLLSHLALTPDGRRIYVSSEECMWEMDPETFQTTRRIPLGSRRSWSTGIAVHPSGRHLFVSCEKTVYAFALPCSSGVAVCSTAYSRNRVVASPDGRYVYVGDNNGQTLTVLGFREEI
ncbi:MAG: hypothetical protein JSU73_05340 [candidate division WOR-3 bacterium]|nr:MAG: hypothetical protein JSU73_05340 [candidate division WOR-3 bacterium]